MKIYEDFAWKHANRRAQVTFLLAHATSKSTCQCVGCRVDRVNTRKIANYCTNSWFHVKYYSSNCDLWLHCRTLHTHTHTHAHIRTNLKSLTRPASCFVVVVISDRYDITGLYNDGLYIFFITFFSFLSFFVVIIAYRSVSVCRIGMHR